MGVVPGHGCQPVQGGVMRTTRGPPNGWCSFVVGDILFGPTERAPAMLRSGYATGNASVVDMWSLNVVPGEDSKPSRICSAGDRRSMVDVLKSDIHVLVQPDHPRGKDSVAGSITPPT